MATVNGEHQAYISVGSNLGDKLANCLKGISDLTREGTSELLAMSRFYRTSPVDYTDQDWFVNAVVKIATDLSADRLLAEMLSIQKTRGRKSGGIRFGPRTLDLDILLYDDCISDAPVLTLPHPRMHKRAFVLQPICDIDRAIIHPVLGMSMGALLDALDDDSQRVCPLDDQPPVPSKESRLQ